MNSTSMVMKRSLDLDSPRRNRRTRSDLDVLNTANNDRYSSSESDRHGRGPSPDSRSLNRKSERRTYDQVVKSDFDDEHFKGKRTDIDEEASVRVTNLTKSAADHVLREKLDFEFKKFGEISVRIVKHGDERYAVVYFRNSEDAREAKRSIENRGRVLLYDRALNLEFNFPAGRSRNYTPDIQQNEGRYSRSSSLGSKVQRDRRSDGFILTDLDEESYARRTAKGDGFYSKSAQSPPPTGKIDEDDDPKATRTLFVGNLETSISRQDVRREFERYGLVEDVDIKRPLRNQGSTYAFVKFIDLDVATKAKHAMQGCFVGRNRVKIGYGKSMPTTRLWVGGLGSWTSLPEVEREFDRFGAIRRIDHNKGDNHAFILYDSLDAASVAAREMRGFQLNGRRLKIDFADLKQGMSEYSNTYSHSSDAAENRHSRGTPEDRHRDEELFHESPEQKRFGRESSDTSGRWSDPMSNNNFKDKKTYSQQSSKDDGWQWEAEKEMERDKWDEKKKSDKGFKTRGPRTPSPGLHPIADHSVLTPSNRKSSERTKNRERPRSADGGTRNRSPPAKRSRKISPALSPQHGNSTSPQLKSNSVSPPSNQNRKSNNEKKNKEKDREKVKAKDKEKTNEKTKESPKVEKEKPVKKEDAQTEPSTSGGSESLQDIAKRFAVAWRGSLILKNSSFPVRLHLIGGNPEIVEVLLRKISGNSSLNTVLRISQRLRLDQPKLEEVSKRMNTAGASGYCMLLALPGIQGTCEPPLDTETNLPTQQRPLRNLVTYLKQKQAAGVVNLINPSSLSPTSIKDDSGVLHAFPPCQYSHDQLLKIAPHLGQDAFREDHLVVVVIRGAA